MKKTTKKSSNVIKLPKQLDVLKLNEKESALLGALEIRHRAGLTSTLDDLALVFAWEAKTRKRSNWWARNSVRKPLRERLVRKVSRGSYAITARGTRFVERSLVVAHFEAARSKASK